MSTGTRPLTIGRLARAAGVGVETVRYYQQRALLPVPPSDGTTYRQYPSHLLQRIRFIKRAQELGFTLDEIGELLELHEAVDRASVRRIARKRLEQIDDKLAALRRMQGALRRVLKACEHADLNDPCPIIETLSGRAPA